MSKVQIAEMNGELMKRGKLLAGIESRIRGLLGRTGKSVNAANFWEERGKLADLADKIVALSRLNALARAANAALDEWEEAATQAHAVGTKLGLPYIVMGMRVKMQHAIMLSDFGKLCGMFSKESREAGSFSSPAPWLVCW